MSEENLEGMTHEEATALEPLTPSEEALLGILSEVWHVLKVADTDLQAHKNAIEALLVAHPNLREALGARLDAARRHAALPEMMSRKYAPVLETYAQKLPDSVRAKALEQMAKL